MANGQGRSFFRAQTLETGRHQAYEQTLEGEYAFSIDRGAKPPFETYNDATRELQGIIQTCVQDGKSLRAHGSLWSLSTGCRHGWQAYRYHCPETGVRSAGGSDQPSVYR